MDVVCSRDHKCYAVADREGSADWKQMIFEGDEQRQNALPERVSPRGQLPLSARCRVPVFLNLDGYCLGLHHRYSGTARTWRGMSAGATSAAIPQRLHQQRKRRRRLPPARVVEVVARIRWAPVLEHAGEV